MSAQDCPPGDEGSWPPLIKGHVGLTKRAIKYVCIFIGFLAFCLSGAAALDMSFGLGWGYQAPDLWVGPVFGAGAFFVYWGSMRVAELVEYLNKPK